MADNPHRCRSSGREVLLLQLPVPSFVPLELTGNIPIAAAGLTLHSRSQKDRPVYHPSLFPQDAETRLGDAALIRRIVSKQPAVVGFTCTVWNIERTLYVAERIRQRLPGTRIWLGGPEVAEDAFFIKDKNAPFDFAVEGEGEAVFHALLSNVKPQEINGLLMPGGKRTKGRQTPCLLDTLDTVHDPFISGLVHSENDKAMLAEFMRGCRHGCHFCRYHQGRKQTSAIRSAGKVRQIFAWARANDIKQIYVLDPSLEQRPDLNDFLKFLAEENREPVIPLFIEMRADHVDKKLAGRLWRAGVREVEVGLQSVNTRTLKRLGRITDIKRMIIGINALREAGIKMQVDVMLGLPGEGLKDMDRTWSFIRKNRLVSSAQVFRTQVFPGTMLRKRAKALGMKYETRPPYFILSTPSLTREQMEGAFEQAEKRLGVSFAPETRPLIKPEDIGHSVMACHPTGPVYYMRFDIDDPVQNVFLGRERFENTANAVVLQIKCAEPNQCVNAILAAVRKFIAANPFSSLTVALEHNPGIALDIYDRLTAEMAGTIPSVYLERLYGRAPDRQQRRVVGCFPFSLRSGINRSWLHSLRDTAGVVWTAPCRTEKDALLAASCQKLVLGDYLYLDIRPDRVKDTERFYNRLLKSAYEPSGILLPALELHWGFVRFQEKQRTGR